MSLSKMMVVGNDIDYTPYISKNPEKSHEIESRYHLRRCRNLLQFIVGLVVVSVVATLIGVLATICMVSVILFIVGIILAIVAVIILLWGCIKMVSNFSQEVDRTRDAEKAELDAL